MGGASYESGSALSGVAYGRISREKCLSRMRVTQPVSFLPIADVRELVGAVSLRPENARDDELCLGRSSQLELDPVDSESSFWGDSFREEMTQ